MGTSNNAHLIEECKNMIAAAKIDDALHILMNRVSKSKRDLIVISGRWAELKRSKRTGALATNEYDIGQARITQSIMDILEEMEREISLLNISEDGEIQKFKTPFLEATIEENRNSKRKFKDYILIGVLVFVSLAIIILNSKEIGFNMSTSSGTKPDIVKEIESIYHTEDDGYKLALEKIHWLMDEKKHVFEKFTNEHKNSVKEIKLLALFKKYHKNQSRSNYTELKNELKKIEEEKDAALLDKAEKIKKNLEKVNIIK